MSLIEHRARSSHFIPSPLDIFGILQKWIVRRRKRRQIAALLEQEDWVLKDMGVTRGDVHEALATSGNPALNLRAIAAKRRFWTRNRDTL